ncbi:NACHT domain-containing protein, partial [Streptomyces sp. e14]|uniref:NACHT domain-containing protein n=1 Tax=Streptomyces sp. e14 TaxID=645465 RepID=UPI0005BBA127
MSAEVAAVRLGTAVAKGIVRLWLGPRAREQNAGSDMSELIRVRLTGLRHRKSIERQFDQIADSVAERLEPHLEREYRGLTQEGREAVVRAVVDAFEQADLSDESLLASDLDAVKLARAVRASVPEPVGFSEAETQLYGLLVAECCEDYAQVIRRLPVFTERAVAEMLARSTSFGDEMKEVLRRLPVQSLHAPQGTGQDEAFRREYLGLVSRSLDEVELFGLGASERAPRTRLSVAYVSLRTSEDGPARQRERLRPMSRAGVQQWEAHETERASTMRAETALKDAPRVLLRGEAGSGKTTLLQWLAVSAARGAFTGALADWNGLIPVLVKLRQYAGAPLPAPEAMLDRVAWPIRGLMPAGWMHRAFTDRRVLLLVDGVDELRADERRGVHEWLRGLLHQFPHTRVVVTSRPAAARGDWLRAENFVPLYLERMTPADLASFVRRWHQAVRDQGAELPCAQDDLPRYERSLLTRLQDRPHLQSLATNPLLAALLCALHLARRGQLPRNRMELYQMALEVLVQHRDADRGVKVELSVPLSLTDKLCLLRDLAWWLSDNGRSEIRSEQAAGRIAAKLRTMPHLDGLDGASVLEYLLHRSGLLRSPAEGYLDFVHRTFQEYLAADEATIEDRIGSLVDRAHRDLWRETVVMAAGHANRTQQEELLGGILDRAEREPRHARNLRLTAASCQETMPSISGSLTSRLDEALRRVLPPRRMSEVDSLAATGSSLLSRLPPTLEGLSDAAARATVATVVRIGGEGALARLERYASDGRESIHQELTKAWEYFDPDAYAQAVLARLPVDDVIVYLAHPGQWRAAARLDGLRWLCVRHPLEHDLGCVEELPPLRGLWLEDVRGEIDLSPLRAQRQLGVLGLMGSGRVHSPSALTTLTELTILELLGWSPLALPSLEALPALRSLDSLRLGRLPEGYDLSPLTACGRLARLELTGSGRPQGLDDLPWLESLAMLDLCGYDLTGWPPVYGLAGADRVYATLADCVLPTDLAVHISCRTVDCLTPKGGPHPANNA